ncbi:broad-spectrum mercury transporter MerE [Pseudomonas aeruginosa]|uniref:broad-spectrum mercury transporter MerE n=1 Tax=Pseudomonas aeruginosa TaxID=287 RepID=UPI003DA72122
MRNTNQSESIKMPRWHAYTWGVLAALTCPCHLPVLALLLSGTAAGAFVSEHWSLATLVLTVLFVLFLRAALRAFRKRRDPLGARRGLRCRVAAGLGALGIVLCTASRRSICAQVRSQVWKSY